jgi:FAD/FMN-containing dehydrogenase
MSLLDDGLAARMPFEVALAASFVGEVRVVDGVAFVTPRDADELSRLVTAAVRLGGRVAVGRSGRPGMAVAALSSLATIGPVDLHDGLVRVGAGALVADVQATVREAGFTLGRLLPSVLRGTVGSWLAGPTRGERVGPSGRPETAALALEAVTPDGGRYASRAVPHGSTGPDLDALLLGSEGRFGLLTTATLRLVPWVGVDAIRSREAVGWMNAVETARRAFIDGLAPVEVRWDRVQGVCEARFSGLDAVDRAERFGPSEVRLASVGSELELAGDWHAWMSSSPLRPTFVRFVAVHAHGAFAALTFDDASEAERAATHARHIGLTVVSPRRLRAPLDAGWGTGARGVLEALTNAVDPAGVLSGA